MPKRERLPTLPAEIVEVIETVLEAAGLDLVGGRPEVERDLYAHFEDGLDSGVSLQELIDRFGDPVATGTRIARTRPRAEARNRGETGRWWMSPRDWFDETRKALRGLRRIPGFAAIVVLTLTLGIGANTAIFTVLNAVLLQDLPYPEADRIVRIFEARPDDPMGGEYLRALLVGEYRGWEEVFDGVASLYTYRETGADLEGERPERVNVLRVSAGYFETLGIGLERGRTFTDDESFGPGEAAQRSIPISHSAIISHGLWGRRFGGAEAVIGQSIVLDGTSYEVVGVMPRGFKNPFGTDSDVWLPHDLRLGGSNSYNNWFLSAVARLRDGVTLEQAQERVKTLSLAYAEAQPDLRDAYPRLIPLRENVVGSARATMLWILAAAASLVLLTACLNVANLVFARGLSRDRDLALRSALGSGRGRIIAGILTENGLLALAGGAGGVGLGWVGVKALLKFAPGVVPMVTEIQVGAAVFLFASVVTVGALLLFGLTPALRMSRTAPADVLRSGDRSSTSSRFVRRVRDGLVVVQVGTALALVVGAALFTRSFSSLVDVPLGVDPAGVLTLEVHLPEVRYADGPARDAFHTLFQDRVAALPSVDRVGATSWLPVSGTYHTWGFYWDPENLDGSNNDSWNSTDVRLIAGDYFGAMGIDVVRGESPGEVDLNGELLTWINQTAATEAFGDTDPVGEQIRLAGEARRVAGVVEDIPHDARGNVSSKSYIPHMHHADDRNWALIQAVKTRGDLAEVESQIREVLAGMDGQLVLFQPRSFETLLTGMREQDRFATLLMGAFAGLALLLSLIGTYAVLAGSVTSRTREIGIRMALGANSSTVRNMILRYAARLTLPGIALGLFGAWVGARWIGALLFEVEASDPVAFAATIGIFLAVGFISAWLPARRATRVDTVQTLTAE